MSEGVGFGNYRLLRRLARGGMAEVFLARQQGVEGFERRVAIKRILPHLSDSAEFRTMFLDEARLAAQLSHPNIIHIYDFGKVEDYFYIAMEYVEGVDLGRLIKQARATPLPVELTARMMADVCAGLHYAHNIGDGTGNRLHVVHRDVTPQNVLITYDGIVKVVDFGIAKATWQASRTRPGVVKGKYAYMSPEQVEGRALDARSDVFSVGICMYELLTGTPLFRRDNVTEAMKEIRDGKPIHPEQHRPDLPAELIAVLHKALQTSRDSRYASAAAMQLDLERFLKGAAGLATPQLLGEYLRREAPPGPLGELLVEGADGEPVVARKSGAEAPPEPRVASGVVKGGTAPISSLKPGVTPAYEASPVAPVDGVATPKAQQDETLTTPGKNVRAVPASKSGPTPQVGFADSNDDEATRKDARAPDEPASHATVRSPKLTPPTGERPLGRASTGQRDRVSKSGQAEKLATRSGPHDQPLPHERSGPSGSFRGTPLGSYPGDSERRPSLANDVTAPTTNPPIVPPPRRHVAVWLVLAVLGVGMGLFTMRRYMPAWRSSAARPLHPALATDPKATDLGGATSTEPGSGKIVTTALPVQTSATIAIYTRPTGAKVFIDGEVLEMLSPVRMQPITAGPHHLVIERVGYQPREIDVTLKVGEHRVLDFELPEERSLQPGTFAHERKRGSPPRAENGFLTARTVPWSRAYDGSRLLGQTPVVKVPLTEGPHTITFVNPDRPPMKKKIVVKAGEELRLNLALGQ